MNSKKIAVVTLNPGVDRIMCFDTPAVRGGHNRSHSVRTDQGSKGANEAIVLKNLGADVEYFSFTGGMFGKISERMTDVHGIVSHFFPTACGVRLNIKIIEPDGTGTEFNESGGPVEKDEFNALLDSLFSRKYDVISLCGSFPQGVDNNMQKSLITRAKATGATVIADTGGQPLFGCTEAGADLIKPNRAELAAFGYGTPDTWKTASSVCGKIHENFGCDIICTLDADGSVYAGADGLFRVIPEPTAVAGFSGAGDAYLAAYTYGKYIAGADTAEALRFGAAAALAKIRLPGTQMPTAYLIEAGLGSIKAEKL